MLRVSSHFDVKLEESDKRVAPLLIRWMNSSFRHGVPVMAAAVGYDYGIVGSSRALNFGYRLRLLF
jgi:hypothetical protein